MVGRWGAGCRTSVPSTWCLRLYYGCPNTSWRVQNQRWTGCTEENIECCHDYCCAKSTRFNIQCTFIVILYSCRMNLVTWYSWFSIDLQGAWNDIRKRYAPTLQVHNSCNYSPYVGLHPWRRYQSAFFLCISKQITNHSWLELQLGRNLRDTR